MRNTKETHIRSSFIQKRLILQIALIVITFFLFFDKANSKAQPTAVSSVSLNNLFYEIDSTFINSFTFNYGLNHIVAIAGSYQLVNQGVDWKVYQTSHNHKEILFAGYPGVIVGGILPIALPYYLYRRGIEKGDKKLQWTSIALGQAAILGATISSSYKAISGRKAPEPDEDGKTEDFSNDFKWGFLERGIFDGWPSGHTTVAFAMATTYTNLYPEDEYWRWAAMSYATWMGLSVSVNIHWFSDAFAGAFMGYAIGKSVASSFKKKMTALEKKNEIQWSVYPVQNGLGLSIIY